MYDSKQEKNLFIGIFMRTVKTCKDDIKILPEELMQQLCKVNI